MCLNHFCIVVCVLLSILIPNVALISPAQLRSSTITILESTTVTRDSISISLPQLSRTRTQKVQALREILNQNKTLTIMPCCYDGLTAKLVEDAGFDLTFMTGFGVSAVNGLPDAGLISVSEMSSTAQTICRSLKAIPCIGDGDTGYGNVANVKRTVQMYIQSGLSGIMIEDQVSPKRCGHIKGKQVVDRDEAYKRIQAAVDARNEGEDIVILARTDARGTHGIEEAIERCKMFRQIGADWTFLEAPESVEEMRLYCESVDGPKLANMLEYGKTPLLTAGELHVLGYSVAAYPLTLLSASIKAMQGVLLDLKKEGSVPLDSVLPFEDVQRVVGFTEYNAVMDEYK